MTDQLSTGVSLDIDDDVAIIGLDDGKANALGHESIDAVGVGLDRALAGAKAVVLTGREGKFSAGFDLSVMTGDDADAMGELLAAGARLCHRLYLHPQPVVAACTGHALALGALLLASCDVRYGIDGPYKIGTNEVAIGMPLPRFGVALAQDRLSRRHLQVAVQHARVYDPSGAVDAGWLDELVSADVLVSTAAGYARQAGAGLHPGALARTREYMRGATGEAMLHGLEADVAEFASI